MRVVEVLAFGTAPSVAGSRHRAKHRPHRWQPATVCSGPPTVFNNLPMKAVDEVVPHGAGCAHP